METHVTVSIILGIISGSSLGNVLVSDRLDAAVGSSTFFKSTLRPSETPLLVITWMLLDAHGNSANIITFSGGNTTSPSYRDRITLFSASGSLELRNLTVSDAGEYRVLIIKDSTSIHRRGSCRLLVHRPVSSVAVASSSKDLLEFSSSVILSCSASGSSLSFSWLNGSDEVTAGGRVKIVASEGGSTLTIVNVTRYDRGPFGCKVSNPVSAGASGSVDLSISYGPEDVAIKGSSVEQYYEEGSNLSLSCSANSRPAATFTWFLNEDVVIGSGPELQLMAIQTSQSGNYSCRAFNKKTQKNTSSSVVPLMVLVPVSNVKVNSSTSEMLEFSGSLSLSCSAFGSSLTFLWLNGSSEVTAGGRVQIVGTEGGSTLTTVNVTRYDRGPFRCHVSSPVSNGTSGPVQLLISFGPENISLIKYPWQESYDEGADINLICSVTSNPSAEFQWFLNGERTPDTGPELRLIEIQMHQSGNYSCEAFNKKTLKSQTSRPVVVSVQKSHISSVVVKASSSDLLELTSSVSLSCSSSGSFPSFHWINSSSEMTTGDRVQLDGDGAKVTVFNVTRYDQGPFRCHVFNNFSNQTSEAVRLHISFGPENINVARSPSQQHHQIGSEVNLSCAAVSRPPASFCWFFNGDQLSDTGPELRLRSVQENQTGEYSCLAFNSKTMKNQTSPPSIVSVLTPVSDVVLTSNGTNLLEFSSSVSLFCSSSGSSVSVLWLNGSSEVAAGGRVQIVGTEGGSTLTIVNVTRYDRGPFRCNVSNGVSQEKSQPLNLIIQYGPDRTAIVGPDSVYTGDFTMLHCSTMSVPSAMVTWFFNGKPSRVQETIYVIRRSRRSDGGTYTCTVLNPVTAQNQTAHHTLEVSDMLACDCSLTIGGAIISTIGLCLVVVLVNAAITCIVVRKKREKSKYPTKKRELLSVKQVHLDTYKVTLQAQANNSTSF